MTARPRAARRVDALMLIGGGDVEPIPVRQDPSETVYGLEPDRDALEIDLLRERTAARTPTLCICRGMQVMNVAFGGSLTQDLPSDGRFMPHGAPSGADAVVHDVKLAGGSAIARAADADVVSCSSHHHQGVGPAGRGRRRHGWSEDGLVEAIERETGWMVGVQWHPEDTAPADPAAGPVRRLVRSGLDHLAAPRPRAPQSEDAVQGVRERRGHDQRDHHDSRDPSPPGRRGRAVVPSSNQEVRPRAVRSRARGRGPRRNDTAGAARGPCLPDPRRPCYTDHSRTAFNRVRCRDQGQPASARPGSIEEGAMKHVDQVPLGIALMLAERSRARPGAGGFRPGHATGATGSTNDDQKVVFTWAARRAGLAQPDDRLLGDRVLLLDRQLPPAIDFALDFGSEQPDPEFDGFNSGLVTDVQVSDDSMHFTLHDPRRPVLVRRRAVTAADVAYTLNLYKNNHAYLP
jgi:putative glutamine amidotransferase